MIVICRHVAVHIADDVTVGIRTIPDARSSSALVIRAFYLKRRGCRAPCEIFT